MDIRILYDKLGECRDLMDSVICHIRKCQGSLDRELGNISTFQRWRNLAHRSESYWHYSLLSGWVYESENWSFKSWVRRTRCDGCWRFGSWVRRTRCDGYRRFELPMAYLLHVSMRIGNVRGHWVTSLMNAHIYIRSGTGLLMFCWRYDLAHWSSLLRGLSTLRGIPLSGTVCHLLWGSSVRFYCEVLLWGSTVRFFCEVFVIRVEVQLVCRLQRYSQ